MQTSITDSLIHSILQSYPDTQAVYLFGSWSSPDQRPDSDLDMAILLPPDMAKSLDTLKWHTFAVELASIAALAKVDLINLRCIDTVFKYQIIMTGERIFEVDAVSADEFELNVMAAYQDLNYQRSAIVDAGIQSGRFYGGQ